MLVVALTALTALTYLHMYVETPHAVSFASRWRPQLIAGNIMSTTGLDMYTKARIALQDGRCVGAILQKNTAGNFAMYVIHRNPADALHLSSILWHPSSTMIYDMRALRSWHDLRFGEELYGSALQSESERHAWDLTSYDA